MDKFCRNCGAKRMGEANFCTECGERFESGEDRAKIHALKNDDVISIIMFGKPKKVKVFSTGDNRYDEKGDQMMVLFIRRFLFTVIANAMRSMVSALDSGIRNSWESKDKIGRFRREKASFFYTDIAVFIV